MECNCGLAAGYAVTKKPGPNCGRGFYTCSAKQCKFFKWEDGQANLAPGPQGRSYPAPAPYARSPRPIRYNPNPPIPQSEPITYGPDDVSDSQVMGQRLPKKQDDVTTMLDILTKSVASTTSMLARADALLTVLENFKAMVDDWTKGREEETK